MHLSKVTTNIGKWRIKCSTCTKKPLLKYIIFVCYLFVFQGNVSFGSGCILAGIGPHDFKVSTNNNKAPFFENAIILLSNIER